VMGRRCIYIDCPNSDTTDDGRLQDYGMEGNVEQELDDLTVLENYFMEIEQLIESSQFLFLPLP
jgi:hypothetical protein